MQNFPDPDEPYDASVFVPEPEQTAQVIRDLRKKSGLSRAQVAVKAGIGIGVLERVEQGKQSPSLMTLLGLAYVFDVGVEDMLDMAHDIPFKA
jgi:transcriptional regulator with XRE-family HTH domain